MTDPTGQAPPPSRLIRLLPSLAVLVAGLTLSAGLYLAAASWERDRAVDQFADASLVRIEQVKKALNEIQIILSAAKAFFNASSFVTFDEFQGFVSVFSESAEGIQAIEWIPRVPGQSRRAFEDMARNTFPAYAIIEKEASGDIAPAGSRSEYYPVFYVYPLKGNETILGFDIASNPQRRDALRTAAESGLAAATAPTPLFQNEKGDIGFLVVLPVYKSPEAPGAKAGRLASLRGFVLGAFESERYFNTALPALDEQGLSMVIRDVTSPNAPQTLFSSAGFLKHGPSGLPGLSKTVPVKVGGRTWEITCSALPGFTADYETRQPLALLIAGILLSALLYAYLASLSGRAARIREEVLQRTSELRESEAAMLAMSEASHDGLIMIDATGGVLFWNKAAERIFGYSPAEALGRDLHALITPEELRGPAAEGLKSFSKTGTGPVVGNIVMFNALRKDGSIVPVERSVASFQFRGEWRAVGSARDITERQAMENALRQGEERLEMAIDGAGLGLWDWNVATGEVYFNDRWAEMLEYRREEIAPHVDSWAKLVHPDDLDMVSQAVRDHLGGATEIYRSEHRMRAKSGNWKWVLDVGKVVSREENGAPLRAVGIHLDLTDLKRLEEELRGAKEDADRANMAKSDFLARMSHEIRTPLNAVIGLSHLAMQADPPKRLRDYLDKIQNSGKLLLGIVNDILDYSRIESGKFILETAAFNLDDVMENMASLLEQPAKDKNLEFAWSIGENVPRDIIGDSLRLTQTLINLAANAIKFTERGHVTVSAVNEETRPDGALLRFSVEDTGIGLNNDEIARLFQSFSQADESITRRYGGAGLGLSICKRLVEMMGGEIAVSSTPGQGSVFSFAVPFKIAQTETLQRQAPSAGARETSGLRGARILLVEDNAINQQVARELLEHAGLSVDVAENGLIALDHLKKAAYDAVLMDVQMPVLDGYAATRRIRTELGLTKLPVLAMTAHALDEERERCLAAGMNDHLVKPISPPLLYAALRRWIAPDAKDGETGTAELEKKTATLPSSAPGLDVAEGLAKVAGNETLYLKLLAEFGRDFMGAGKELRRLIQAGDLEAAERLVHTVKGVSGNLAARGLFQAASELTEALRAGDRDFSTLLDVFCKELDAVRQGIALLVKHAEISAPQGQVIEPDPGAMKPLFRKLDALIIKNSMEAESCLEEIKLLPYGKPFSEALAPLEDMVGRFDFASAREALAVLAAGYGVHMDD